MEKYFIPHFIKYAKPKKEDVLIMDGFRAHFEETVKSAFNKESIQIQKLAPNSTCITQPLDVSIFKSVKTDLRKKYRNHIIANFDEVGYLFLIFWAQYDIGLFKKEQKQ